MAPRPKSPHGGPHVTVTPEGPSGAPRTPSLLTASAVLSEPPLRSSEWLPAVVRRLLVASRAPVALGPLLPAYRDRFEAAGWFVLAPDSTAASDPGPARAQSWPAHAALSKLCLGYGSPAPALVLVGSSQGTTTPYPLANKTGACLFKALRSLGWDELSVYVTNTKGRSGGKRRRSLPRLYEAMSPSKPIWLAIGSSAHADLEALEIPHLHAPSPWDKTDQGDYAQSLLNVGLPKGRWADSQEAFREACPPVRTLPDLPEPFGIRSVSPPSPKAEGVAIDKLSRARLAYVTSRFVDLGGKVHRVPTLTAAAALTSCCYEALKRVAREQNWEAERLEHQAEVVEEAKSAARAQEAKSYANATRLAWVGTERYLGRLIERLRDDKIDVTAQGARALAQCAITLSEATINPEGDEETDRLAGLSLPELQEELNRVLSKHAP